MNMFQYENVGVRSNLYKIFNHGRLAGSGKLVIYAVDQGFEHGPIRSFAMNEPAYDPEYHFSLAVNLGFSAIAAPLGFLQTGGNDYVGRIPMILKLNSSNSLSIPPGKFDQAVTGSIQQALQLGCVAVGVTFYPGAENCLKMQEYIAQLSEEAKSVGLAVVIWSYARGNMNAKAETAIDIVSYGAHMACLMGANIVKVKMPSSFTATKYGKELLPEKPMGRPECIEQIVKSCFDGKRVIIFSGGETTTDEQILEEIADIAKSRAYGSIVGRNIFKRKPEEAKILIDKMMQIYKK